MRPRSLPVRYGVAGMLFITVAINYLDRGNLAVAATDLAADLRLDPVRLGFLFSAFGWAYALCQIPGGWLVDRIGPRGLYASVCGLWSLATLAQGLASAFLVLFGLRLLLGLFEAPTFPICSQLVTRWFPERERAGAIGFYTAGQFACLAFLTPVLVYAQHRLGWRSVFFLTGGLGLVWAALWYACYRDPAHSRRLQPAERDLIRAGGGWVDGGSAAEPAPRVQVTWGDLRFVLTQRKLWGLYLGQFALNAIPWFFLTWFPTYLVSARHIDFNRASWATTSLPFVGAFAGVIAGGVCSDWMVRRGVSPTFARKAPIIAGMLLSTSVIGANFATGSRGVLFFLTLAFFGNGFASITWTLVSLVAPKRLLGLTGGVFNFCGNGAPIVVPLVIGYLVKHGGFAPALAFIAVVALGGALAYGTLVGKVERIAE
jgi:ACS family D-galactonate transporter-like MFS transporter